MNRISNNDPTKWDKWYDGTAVEMLSTIDFMLRYEAKQRKQAM